MLKIVLLVIYAFTAAIIGGIIMNLIMMAYYATLVARLGVGNETIDNVVYWISLKIGLAVGIYLMWTAWPKEKKKKVASAEKTSEENPLA